MTVPSQITVKDANGSPVIINAPLNPGRAPAAESGPAALSDEDFALLQNLAQPTAISAGSTGLASTQILAADATRLVVTIQNVSATAYVGVASGSAAMINTGGSMMIGPYQTAVLRGGAAQAAINAISDTVGTQLTIGVG